MQNQTIRWGIIGCGDVTEVKSGPAFNKVPNSKLVAVMRRNADKAKDYAQRHGVPKWYGDAAALINDPEVDAVYIATPPLQHEDYTVQALRAGKPVYVEKPMALNATAAGRMVATVNQTGVKLSLAHYRRRQPLFLKAKSLLKEGAIGEPRAVNLQFFRPDKTDTTKPKLPWRLDPAVSGGGLFHDLAPHQLDLLHYFFGEPSRASGIALNTAAVYKADDTVSGQILFPNKVLFTGAWSFTVAEHRDVCEIIGSEGSLRFAVFEHKELVLKRGEDIRVFSFDPLPHVQQPMIAAVVDYFLGRGPNPCSAQEGLSVMQMMESFTAKNPQER